MPIGLPHPEGLDHPDHRRDPAEVDVKLEDGPVSSQLTEQPAKGCSGVPRNDHG